MWGGVLHDNDDTAMTPVGRFDYQLSKKGGKRYLSRWVRRTNQFLPIGNVAKRGETERRDKMAEGKRCPSHVKEWFVARWAGQEDGVGGE